jgi:predicted amidohydrolase
MDKHIYEYKAPPNASGKKVVVGLIQTSVSEDLAANMEKTQRRIEEAAARGAKIICLQELYRSRYFPQEENVDVTALTESIPGTSTDAFSALAKKLGVVIVAPIYEKNPNGKTITPP